VSAADLLAGDRAWRLATFVRLERAVQPGRQAPDAAGRPVAPDHAPLDGGGGNGSEAARVGARRGIVAAQLNAGSVRAGHPFDQLPPGIARIGGQDDLPHPGRTPETHRQQAVARLQRGCHRATAHLDDVE
jgi:hypothetical protein